MRRLRRGFVDTALAPNLAVLILGWSVLGGIGAALILPAIMALVAGNVPPAGRPRAYRLVMGAGAIAVAVAPLIGGVATTYFSWRWVFAGEVLMVLGILALARRVRDAPPEARVRFDLLGAVLAAIGLGAAVFGVLRSADWGWVTPKASGPSVLGSRRPCGWCSAGCWSSGCSSSGRPTWRRPVGAAAAAIGTALTGSILIAALTTSFVQGVQQNPAIPDAVKAQAGVQLAGGVPFLSDADLRAALDDAGASTAVTEAALAVNAEARLAGLRAALAVLAVIALLGLFSARRIPTRLRPPPAERPAAPSATSPSRGDDR